MELSSKPAPYIPFLHAVRSLRLDEQQQQIAALEAERDELRAQRDELREIRRRMC